MRPLCAAFAIGLSGPFPVEAAVRQCTQRISSELTRATTEREAHRQAIASWTARAKAAGIAHPAWRIASQKLMKCLPAAAGFECIAIAAPCTIRQKVPRVRPHGPKRDT